MSETQDLLIYNFYDYMKIVYIYPHVKTYLIDPDRRDYELTFSYILLVISSTFMFVVGLKIVVILVYFLFAQTLTPFVHFLRLLCKSKFKIDCRSSLKNACEYLGKIFKRFFTFNFYLFQNILIDIIMILSYLLFLICNLHFLVLNIEQIDLSEKTMEYMYMFYIHFESFILIQILCSSFYACRNMKIAIISAFAIFALLNGITIIVYLAKERYENVEGLLEYSTPQKIVNIIYNLVLGLLNGTCFFNFVTHKKKSK